MAHRDPYPDNDLIDAMADEAGGATMQNDSRGGNLARDVGSRAEQRDVEGKLDADETDRPRASDRPDHDWQKGDDAIASMPTSPY